MYKLIRFKDDYINEYKEIYVYQDEYGYWSDVNGRYGFTEDEFKEVEIIDQHVEKSSMKFPFHCIDCDIELLYCDTYDGCCNNCDQVNAIEKWITSERLLDNSFIYYKSNNELQAILYYYEDMHKMCDSKSGLIYIDTDYEYDCYHLHILDSEKLSKITEE